MLCKAQQPQSTGGRHDELTREQHTARRQSGLAMTLGDLKRIIEQAVEDGRTDGSPVMLATQPTYPLVSSLAYTHAVVLNDDRDLSYLVLCEGGQRHDGESGPYLNDDENVLLENWTRRHG